MPGQGQGHGGGRTQSGSFAPEGAHLPSAISTTDLSKQYPGGRALEGLLSTVRAGVCRLARQRLVIITVLYVAATEVTKRRLYLLQGSHRPPPR
jgi:hypothetical protein